MTRLIIALIAAAVLLGCSDNGENTEAGQEAATQADAESSPVAEAAACHENLDVTDDGASLIIDTGTNPVPLSALDCVYEALEMPKSIIARIERTRALDGTQDGSWGALEASWTYHPDNGLNLIVEKVDESPS